MLQDLHWLQSPAHRFQAGCARLPMPAWSGATVSFRLHPVRRRFQPLPSSVVIILVHGCPPSAIVHFRWLEAASGRVTSRSVQDAFGTSNFGTLLCRKCHYWYSLDDFSTGQLPYLARRIQCRVQYIKFASCST